MGWDSNNRIAINKGLAVASGLVAVFFFIIGSYFQTENYLSGSSEVLTDLWLVFLWNAGFCIWYTRTKEDKKK